MQESFLFTLVFLSLPFYLVLAETNFHFNAEFKCDLPQKWCVKQIILESEVGMNRYLVGPKKGCTTDPIFKIQLEYKLKSGVEHDFLTAIHHNCSDTNTMWVYEPRIGKFISKESDEDFEVDYTINLTNQNAGYDSVDTRW